MDLCNVIRLRPTDFGKYRYIIRAPEADIYIYNHNKNLITHLQINIVTESYDVYIF